MAIKNVKVKPFTVGVHPSPAKGRTRCTIGCYVTISYQESKRKNTTI